MNLTLQRIEQNAMQLPPHERLELIHRLLDTLAQAVVDSSPNLKQQRQFGSAKGLIHIADNFDDPLEEFAEYR